MPIEAWEADMRAQRHAKAWLHTAVVVCLSVFAIGIGVLYLLRVDGGSPGSVLNDNVFLGALMVWGIAMLLVAHVVQWYALLKFQVRCPHCEKRLATRVRVLPSPSPFCPHCGELAIQKEP